MSLKTYKLLRLLATMFVAGTVSSAVVQNNFALALIAVVTGMVFMFVIKKKTKGVFVDERVLVVGEKAAKASYVVTTLTLAVSSFILTFVSRNSAPFLSSLATVLSYLTLFALSIYSIAFYYYNHKYGSDNEE